MTEGNDSNLNNEHDIGYKFLFSAKKVFIQLLRSFVKAGWVQHIDETNIEKVDKSYILQDFNEKEADLVYKLKIQDQEVIFYLLMELQSKVDFQMPYRLLLYMTEIWRDILKNSDTNATKRKSFRLPVIVPIVLYNGKNTWSAPLEFKETLNNSDMFGEQVLNFKYILLDINRYNKQDLMEVSNLISTVFFLDQDVEGIDELINRLDDLVGVLSELSEDEFSLFKAWLKKIVMRRFPSDQRESIETIIDSTNPKEVSEMISNLEENLKKFETKAKIIGIDQGKKEKASEIARNLLAKGMDIKEIADVTGLDEKEVEKLRMN